MQRFVCVCFLLWLTACQPLALSNSGHMAVPDEFLGVWNPYSGTGKSTILEVRSDGVLYNLGNDAKRLHYYTTEIRPLLYRDGELLAVARYYSIEGREIGPRRFDPKRYENSSTPLSPVYHYARLNIDRHEYLSSDDVTELLEYSELSLPIEAEDWFRPDSWHRDNLSRHRQISGDSTTYARFVPKAKLRASAR